MGTTGQETGRVRWVRLALVGLLLAGLFSVLPFAAVPTAALSADIVISAVYGGGGNSGSTFKNDYIELFNRGTSPVSVNGYSVQYASAAGTAFAVTPLGNKTIQPGAYFLVGESGGTGGTTNLPATDATGTINLSGTNGKVALVTSTTAISCGGPVGSCAALATVKDFVGFGTASDYENANGGTTATVNDAVNDAVTRKANGCTETDSNSNDFASATAAPRNASSPTNPCGPVTPSITLTPTNGPAAGGTTVTITGMNTNFVAGTTTVTFGGVAATSVMVNSPTSLMAVTPAAANMTTNSTVDVVVTTGTQIVTAANAFTYTVATAPTVTSITPTTGLTTGGTAVTITGTNFVNMGTTTVTFTKGGMTANVVGTVTSATTITATSPASPDGTAGAATVTVTNNGVVATGNAPFTYQAVAGRTRIHDIQGARHVSPLADGVNTSTGATVTNVPGIVTARKTNGFFFQDPNPDADDATSEGIFVFTSSTPPAAAAVGNSVLVTGRVQEFRRSNTDDLTLTEIVRTDTSTPVAVAVVAMNQPLPAPMRIGTVAGSGVRVIPARYDSPPTGGAACGGSASVPTCNLDDPPSTSGLAFDPANDAVDFFESLEGMRIEVVDLVETGPRDRFSEGTSSQNDEISTITDNGAAFPANKRTINGGVRITSAQDNPQRVILSDNARTDTNTRIVSFAASNTGATFSGSTVGVLDYNFSNFKLDVTALGTYTASTAAKESTAVTPAGQVSIASFNVQNLDPSDGTARFAALGTAIVNNLKSPDILTLEEIQDNNGAGGPAGNTVVSACANPAISPEPATDPEICDPASTAGLLIAAIATAGGPTYRYVDVRPVYNQDGGEQPGNIRVAFLYHTDHATFVRRPGGDATTPNTVVRDAEGTHLRFSPGRIDPTNPNFDASRKPLAGEFIVNGNRIFVIANHFNSKGGDTPNYGRFQPPRLTSEPKRIGQATVVNAFVQQLLGGTNGDANAKVIIGGDLNDFEFSNPLTVLRCGTTAPCSSPILEDLPATRLADSDRYTYVFQGNSQVLDHILVSTNISSLVAAYDSVHLNSDFFDQLSDHDPQVVRLTLTAPIVPSQATYTFSGPANGNTGPQNFSVTAKLTPGTDITDQTRLRYRATLTRDGVAVSGLAVNYNTPGDMGTFTLDGSGAAFFGPVGGFRYGDVPGLTTTGVATNFTSTLTQPGTYTLTVQLVNIAASPNANVGTPGAITFTLVSPDLSLTKTHSGASFNVGGTGTYTITVANSGMGPTTGDIVVTDTLPAGLTFAPAGSGGNDFTCTASGQAVACTRPASAGVLTNTAGSNTLTLTLNVTVTAAAAPSVMNSATVTTTGDANAANNTGTDTTPVVSPDLTATKSHTGNFTVGQNGTYTITVENTGTGTNQSPITLVDTLPSGLTFVSGTGTNSTCAVAMGMPQTVNCTFSGQLTGGGSPATTRTTITLVVAVGSAAIPGGMNTATLTNTVVVSTPNEGNTANNTATDPTTVEFAAPTATGVAPNHGPTTGGTSVTITGTGFRAGATVTFDGVAATSVTVVNDTTITAVSPAGSAGPKNVIVRNSDLKVSNAQGFVYEQMNVMPSVPLRVTATAASVPMVPAPAPPMRAASTAVPMASPPLPAPPRR